MSAHHDDLQLARRLLVGDEAAFDRLFRDVVPPLFRIAAARLDHDQDAAEDVVQSTLVVALRKIGTYRGEAALLTWLTTICRHEIFALRRRDSRGPAPLPLDEASPEIEAALELLNGDDPERDAVRAEVRGLVRATLERLPPRYAEVLTAKYLRDRSMRQIAEQLGVTPVAVQSLLQRARAAFRDGFRGVGAVAGLGPAIPPHGERPDA